MTMPDRCDTNARKSLLHDLQNRMKALHQRQQRRRVAGRSMLIASIMPLVAVVAHMQLIDRTVAGDAGEFTAPDRSTHFIPVITDQGVTKRLSTTTRLERFVVIGTDEDLLESLAHAGRDVGLIRLNGTLQITNLDGERSAHPPEHLTN